jgi:hypothetical protein
MRSLAKPRKVTIHGSDGQKYAFLGKPKDDLRKDARLMDFNSIINKILNMNSDSRRRKLRMSRMARYDMTAYDSTPTDIRTYGIVTLNEECGFIQWVPDTIAMRYVLLPLYDARGQRGWVCQYPSSRTPILCHSNRMRRCKPYLNGLGGQAITRLARYLRRKSCRCKLYKPACWTLLTSRFAGFLQCSTNGF